MRAVARAGWLGLARLAALLALQGPAAAAVAADPEEDGAGQCLTGIRLTEPKPTVAGFDSIYRRDGLVLVSLGSSHDDFVEAGMGLADSYLNHPTEHQPEGLHHMDMAWNDGDPMNPENDTKQISPLRLRYRSHHTLAPADNYAQGPHQEGASPTRGNRRCVVFLCEEPAERGGGTAFFDMARAWELVPKSLQQTLRHANFVYKQFNGLWLKVPTVVKHDISGRPCVQFYCFGRVARDCIDVYRQKTRKFHVKPDIYSYNMDPETDLLLEDGKGNMRPFVGLELYELLEAIYSSMLVYEWHRGDTMLVDNIRWAHARLEGVGPDRKVHFLIYGPGNQSLDLTRMERP